MKRTREQRIEFFVEVMEGICSSCFTDNLIEAGYFDAPAGIKHHGAYEGGLFEHSIQVTYELCELSEKLNLKWERQGAEKVIGLFHDLCKMQQLTKEEIYCIRYHMGAYEGQPAWDFVDRAIKQYPNILYTHMADMIASKLKEV